MGRLLGRLLRGYGPIIIGIWTHYHRIVGHLLRDHKAIVNNGPATPTNSLSGNSIEPMNFSRAVSASWTSEWARPKLFCPADTARLNRRLRPQMYFSSYTLKFV